MRAKVARRLRIARSMSDARQSPIPQDRVNENIDESDRAAAGRDAARDVERDVDRHGATDDLPGTNPEAQPGIPDDPTSPAEGGD